MGPGEKVGATQSSGKCKHNDRAQGVSNQVDQTVAHDIVAAHGVVDRVTGLQQRAVHRHRGFVRKSAGIDEE